MQVQPSRSVPLLSQTLSYKFPGRTVDLTVMVGASNTRTRETLEGNLAKRSPSCPCGEKAEWHFHTCAHVVLAKIAALTLGCFCLCCPSLGNWCGVLTDVVLLTLSGCFPCHFGLGLRSPESWPMIYSGMLMFVALTRLVQSCSIEVHGGVSIFGCEESLLSFSFWLSFF